MIAAVFSLYDIVYAVVSKNSLRAFWLKNFYVTSFSIDYVDHVHLVLLYLKI